MSDGEHRIRERAHQLWEHAGRPDHRSDEFWAQAEAEVKRAHVKPTPGSDAKAPKKTAPETNASKKSAKAEATGKPEPPPVEKPVPAPAKPKAEAKAPAKPKPKK